MPAGSAASAFSLIPCPSTLGNPLRQPQRRQHHRERWVLRKALSHRQGTPVRVGSGPLRIQGVHAACGCTAVEADKGKVYASNESGYVDITLDTTDFVGSMMKVVTVMTNESITPDRTLTVRANVLAEFEVQPPLVDFGDIVSKDGAERIIKIIPIKDFALKVENVDFPKDLFEVKWTKDAELPQWAVTVRLKPNQKIGFLKDVIRVKTNSNSLPQLEVPVRGTIRENIAIAPAYLEFGAIAQTERVKRDVTLSGVEAFQITGSKAELIVNGKAVKDASEFVSIAAVDNPSARKRVAVELKNISELGGSVHGKLYLQTNDQSQPQVEVDFYAFFR